MLVTAGVFSISVNDPDEAAHLARKLARRGHQVVLGVSWTTALCPIENAPGRGQTARSAVNSPR